MHYQTEKQIEDLMNAFIDRTLPKDSWTHEAHLTGALWHLMNHDFYEAVCLIKSRIITYNLSTGGVNTSTRGYHETITIFWMKLISVYIEQHKGKSLLIITNQFLASPLAVRSIIDHFYNKERLMSPEARSIYITADKKEISLSEVQTFLK